ncbi:MAG: VanZ family protein [Cyanobacteria bacterium J06642_3]
MPNFRSTSNRTLNNLGQVWSKARLTLAELDSVRFLAKYWSYFLVVSNVAVILIVTLHPYSFVHQDYAVLIMRFKRFFNSPGDIYDLISNVLLFVLLGFGLGRILQRQSDSKVLILIISLLVSTNLSLIVEILQMFLPRRTSSLWDLLANTIGGVGGTMAFFFWQSTWISLNRRRLNRSRLSLTAFSYTLLVLCLMFALQRAHNFSNWNPNFPLSIGNEPTGDRPWQGRIEQVYFATHSLSKKEIAQTFSTEHSLTTPWFTGYQLTGNGDYADQKGRSPNLSWQEVPPTKDTQGMISLSQQHWLLTPEPAIKLNQALKKTSQFSLLTTVATKDTHQTGPARIISLSDSPFRRNLTIGQQNSGVVVRLRTPLSGLGQSNTNLTFPNILADTKPHQLLFNFDGKTLQLFVDHPKEVHTLNLSPAILFFHFLPAIGIRGFQITPTNKWMLQLAFYGLMLSPPAALVVLSKFNNTTPENTA